jgi:hypothetical protein
MTHRIPLLTFALVSCLAAACEETEPCTEGEWTCSEDAYTLTACVGGRWQTTECQADQGKLCEDGACVDPWRYGAPTYGTCPDEPQATAESLHDKMIYYEAIVRRLHLHPDMAWVLPAELKCLPVTCPVGQDPPCEDCTQPVVPETDATWQDVRAWRSGENDGLWSALYLTSQAYRYAVTGEAEALDVIHLMLEGERQRFAITSVPGLLTRQLIPPGVDGIACPEAHRFVPDEEKDDNQWVMVGADGCLQVADASTLTLHSTDRCGLDEFAGWCWLDNASMDEYSGNLLALAAIIALVDDPTARAQAADLLSQVGHHLKDHDLEIYDWDGRRTEHGQLWPWPAGASFFAAQILGYVKAAIVATDDAELTEWYDTCLLQKDGPLDCWPDNDFIYKGSFADALTDVLIYFGGDDCKSNWNNFAMMMVYLHTLMLVEHDPFVVEKAHVGLQKLYDPDDATRPLSEQKNAYYDFIWGAMKALGPASDGPALTEVESGVCMMKQFPASQHERAFTCPPETCPLAASGCTDRFDEPMGDHARTPAERCVRNYLWWANPYKLDSCTENLRVIEPPADFLLPYWMGRYHGFIPENL